jgi:uncharacterized secreted protein with C-terminal beta-propeller domain
MKKLNKFLYILLFGLFIFPQISLGAECNPASLSPIQYREKSETVKNTQLCLQKLGFKISEATGYFGKETMQAIKDYYTTWYGKWNGLRLGTLGIQKIKTSLTTTTTPISSNFSLIKFNSSEEYKTYLETNSNDNQIYNYGLIRGMVAVPTAPTNSIDDKSATYQSSTGAVAVDRYSSTNNQVLNIDEPDIAKTNGQTIFYKSYSNNNACPAGAMCTKPLVASSSGKISLIKALPVNQLSVESKINLDGYYYSSGDLLLNNNILIVLENKKVKSYDVSNTKDPKEKWSLDLDEKTTIEDARLKDGKIYLITKSSVNDYKNCPITILKNGTTSLSLGCNDIYHPTQAMAIDTNYTAISINPTDGSVINKLSFLGSSSSSTIYMSENNLYVAYNYSEDQLKYYLNFLKEKGTDLFPTTLISKLEKVSAYDISSSSKWTELQNELNKYYNSLSSDDNLRITNEFNNRLTDYSKTHFRDLEKTAIVKIGLNNLDIVSTGNVPGKLLNQFSVDEYNNNLRVAVTIGGTWNLLGSRTTSTNDIYVLDDKLSTIGSIKDLGTTERIYSARFIGNRGYLVTFRQTDPFYVLDLSIPTAPAMKGELKIPGYSAYLHPITDNIILGVGKENSQVKLSLFDVTSPENPTEISKYSLTDYWTEVESNHHAFLLDKTHNVFFIPASQGGYIFSYKENKLTLVKTIKDYNIKRAVYINDYLYMLGDDKMTVLDENSWEKVGELEIK